MPGQRINFKQVQLYLKARRNGCTQETSAAKGGFCVRTGRRIEKGQHQPQRDKPRHWRTRKDPLAEVWESELVPLLQQNPQLMPMTLLEYLQEKYPDKYEQKVYRTLARRVREWKATAGPPKEVMFPQRHEPGAMGLSDFTHFKEMTITIKGQPFEHLLYHYRLAYSGWQYVQVIQGGESFVALTEGLQNALWRCGGSPKNHRTDSLSAAYRNEKKLSSQDLTDNYQQLCQHYQMQPTRNNRGCSHENGGIESPHGHFKRRLYQALLIRGSADFKSVLEYQQLIEKVVTRLNQKYASKFDEEKEYLQSLPTHRLAEYQIESVRVTCHSTITVRCILYTVPSQLIGHRLTVHIYHDRLIGFLAHQPVVELPRFFVAASSGKRRARCVNYRHIIDSLRRKPRAFLQCQWRDDLLPNDNYRRIWQQLIQQFPPYEASRLMVESLYLAAHLDKESAIERWLFLQLREGTLTLIGLQQSFQPPPGQQWETSVIEQHPLSNYDRLLHYDFSPQRQRDVTHFTQDSEVALHETAMANS